MRFSVNSSSTNQMCEAASSYQGNPCLIILLTAIWDQWQWFQLLAAKTLEPLTYQPQASLLEHPREWTKKGKNTKTMQPLPPFRQPAVLPGSSNESYSSSFEVFTYQFEAKLSLHCYIGSFLSPFFRMRSKYMFCILFHPWHLQAESGKIPVQNSGRLQAV